MLGESINILIGGTGGTAKTLTRINQDNYTAEYLCRESLCEYRAKVTHTKSKNGDRHFMEIRQTVFAVAPSTEDKVRTASVVISAKGSDDTTLVVDLYEALQNYLTGAIATRVVGWES